MLEHLKPDDPLSIVLTGGRPATVEGLRVERVLANNPVSPHCWNSLKLCESWSLEAGGRRFEIYQVDDGWFFMKFLD